MKEKEEYDLNLGKYRNHKRAIPWGLIRKIIVAAVLIGLMVYLKNVLAEKENKEVQLPDEVEL